ncbi:N-acetylglucosaminyl-phosphatidylinositol de-N-acetylase [Gnomoniopsis sp. IMI 355080]|nr:N-acetylglucosaminyl-phosphatidylinositol de-N-acetylase [Gnomoniopsis sp. IMI 355080]
MDPALLTLSLLVLLLPTLYLYTVGVVSTRLPMLRGKRICLLIAHPDDEAMFFAPTVLALTRPELQNHVKILCLSSGDAEGLGETRKEELTKSGLILGLRKAEDVFIVDNPVDFPDSMKATWPSDKISSLLREAFTPKPAAKVKPSADQQPSATIDVLITFDAQGISSHPNHISLYHGARAFVTSLIDNKPGWSAPVHMYTLTSVSIFRKFTGILDVLSTLGSTAFMVWRGRPGSQAVSGAEVKKNPAGLVFMHGLGRGGWLTAREAMTSAHVSQMVWFRFNLAGSYQFLEE